MIGNASKDSEDGEGSGLRAVTSLEATNPAGTGDLPGNGDDDDEDNDDEDNDDEDNDDEDEDEDDEDEDNEDDD